VWFVGPRPRATEKVDGAGADIGVLFLQTLQ
jgi:hypothetical protein